VKAYVAITDNDWFWFLKQRPNLDEVNFWQPGGNRLFRALDPGQPFLFKLHAPDHFIVGGGFFAHASILPCSLAWDTFGEKNGAASLVEMRRRIEKYRKSSSDRHEDYKIGCIILLNPFFFERKDWIPVPADFHLNTQQGKSYDLRSSSGKTLWDAVSFVLQSQPVMQDVAAEAERKRMYGEPILMRPRLGQGTFPVLVTDTYQRRCAVTGEKALPVVQAAHIRPVKQGGEHRIDNGLLLRSDVHALFDRGYVTVAPDYQFRVSRRLKDDYDNGEHYFQFQGMKIWLPPRSDDRPNRAFLEWHADEVFLG